jgi:predicted nucleic acid-binding protein
VTVYVDTSVVVRVLLREPNPLRIWGQWNKAYSSGLWRVEALRTVDRLRLTQEISDTEVAELVREIQIVHETFTVHPVTNQILQRASETFPTVVGTLDAIHLATALSVRQIEPLDSLLTHGSQLGTAAKSLGFHVLGYGWVESNAPLMIYPLR